MTAVRSELGNVTRGFLYVGYVMGLRPALYHHTGAATSCHVLTIAGGGCSSQGTLLP
jgi:hypothetical protein